jgi:hypothetical protein
MTLKETAERIGTGVRAVSDAEHGKPTTAISVYFALLWIYGMLSDIEQAADPNKDKEGLMLDALRTPKRARALKKEMDNDF